MSVTTYLDVNRDRQLSELVEFARSRASVRLPTIGTTSSAARGGFATTWSGSGSKPCA